MKIKYLKLHNDLLEGKSVWSGTIFLSILVLMLNFFWYLLLFQLEKLGSWFIKLSA